MKISSSLPIKISLSKIEDFCKRNKIEKLSLFGSVLRNDFNSKSDIDVLVEFEKGKTPGLVIVDLQDELSEMFGREVDLHTPAELSRFFKERVLQEALLIYGKNRLTTNY